LKGSRASIYIQAFSLTVKLESKNYNKPSDLITTKTNLNFRVMPENNRDVLLSLLAEAALEMKNLGDRATFWSHYDTCQDLGNFIEKAKNNLAKNDETDVVELWTIFIPTSDWDDSGGSMILANKIFAFLNKLYGDKIGQREGAI